MEAFVASAIGEYRLVQCIGSGGMGDVYRAVHTRLGRVAAIKLLKGVNASPSARERFLNEARIQADLSHPNIAVLYDFSDAGRCPYIIMEYVEGRTLHELLQQGGRLELKTAMAHFRKIVQAIAYIHGRNIIHRDIKPTNIKVTPAGDIKLLDFGISKSPTSECLTGDGSLLGTDQYLAPEQLQGQTASPASDIWALGVLLYELVTGRIAFESTSRAELYHKIINASFTAPSIFAPGLPVEVERLILSCLRKNPHHRFPSAKALLREVEACQETPLASGGLGSSLKRWLPRPRPWLAVSLVSLLLVAAGGWIVVQMLSSEAPPVDARGAGGQVGPDARGGGVAPAVSAAGDQKEGAASQPKKEAVAPPEKPLREVRINVTGGSPAQVFLELEGKKFGPFTTPYKGSHPYGARVHFLLQRPGFQDCKGDFNVQDLSSSNTYTYRMCEKGKVCPELDCK